MKIVKMRSLGVLGLVVLVVALGFAISSWLAPTAVSPTPDTRSIKRGGPTTTKPDRKTALAPAVSDAPSPVAAVGSAAEGDSRSTVSLDSHDAAVPAASSARGVATSENGADSHDRMTQAIDMSAFAGQLREIEAALAQPTAVPNEDRLVAYGRSAAASGQFDLAAAAYARFLNEFGTDHPYAEQVATRLAESLSPLDLSTVDVIHTPDGPRFNAVYRMDQEPPREHLQQALAVFEWLVESTRDRPAQGNVLLRMGWVHRALNDWEASTEAWDRCAEEAAGTGPAAEALWLASENLEWTGKPADAATHVERLVQEYPDDPRAAAAAVRLETLQAEARRGPEWHADPVASLLAEVQQRRATHSPQAVYQEVLNWLRRTGASAESVAVSRWAIEQTDWETSARLAAHLDLADGLLNAAQAGEVEKEEAINVLTRQIQLAGEEEHWLLPAAMKLSRLLRELDRAAEAAALWETILAQPLVAPGEVAQTGPERVRVLLAVHDRQAAEELLEEIRTNEPDHPEIAALHTLMQCSLEEDE